MKSKEERFIEWRGESSARKERAYINTVPLVDQYVKSFISLAELWEDIVNPDSEKIKILDAYNRRTMGILLYCKLTIDEITEKIPETFKEEKDLLAELSHILSEAYINPTSNVKSKVDGLILRINQLLDREIYSDPKLAKELTFVLYLMLSTSKRSLKKNEGLASWFIDVKGMYKILDNLLNKTEKKAEKLDKLLSEQASKSLDRSKKEKTIQDQLNERFLIIFSENSDSSTKLGKLQDGVKEASECLTSIVNLRKEKGDISAKIITIQSLLNAVEENDKKITGRQYFLDLVNSNKQAFDILMDVAKKGDLKTLLEEKIEQIRNPGFYQNVSAALLYGASWVTSLTTVVYRALTSQDIQETVTDYVPSTQDSEAKALLKELARQQIRMLTQQLHSKYEELSQKYKQLSSNNPELEELLANASSENLAEITKAIDGTGIVLVGYKKIKMEVKSKLETLKKDKLARDELADFIEKNDNWLVRLSNWLAENIHEIFKTDTARMIDKARKAQQQLEEFEKQYETEIKASQIEVENSDSLSPELKEHLKNQLSLNETDQIGLKKKGFFTRERLETITKEIELRLHPQSSEQLDKENSKHSEEEVFFRPFDIA
ncbi:purine NTPase [Legionella norrlandica]|uniref:Purine NTPase n=1 Tax=Legionella norrlandica TaxID=1498499 RepID=A0A0A2SW69_9GAMM|nr:purine NTPase [Legionella norrlandica]KGP63961.1 purine NTPase [Legionella norrlandica]